MADNALTKLPLGGQLGVSLGLAVLIGGLFYWQKYDPMLKEEAKKKTQLEDLQKDIRALEVTANKLGEFTREVQLLEARLDTLKRILPPEKETPDLMKKVQALASQSNLSVKNFTPGTTAPKEFYQEWPINVGLEGNFHNLGLFFDRVSRLSRLVNAGNLKIKTRARQTSSQTITATCVATTFVYVDAPPPPPAGAKGQPARPGAKK